MADQADADRLMQQLAMEYQIANATQGTYYIPPERLYSPMMSPLEHLRAMVTPPQFNGYIVLNARAIALDAPDKLVKRAIKLPFVPVAGMVLRVTDGYALPIRDDTTKHDVVFAFRVIESLWDEQQEQFQARCEKIDGQGYERLADAVHWESYK